MLYRKDTMINPQIHAVEQLTITTHLETVDLERESLIQCGFTVLLASPECENTEQARARIVQAQETDTILTRAFDLAQGLAWPPQYPGRALRNRFTDQWHSNIDALPQASEARQQLAEAIASKNYDLANIYAGEAVGLVTRQQSAGEVSSNQVTERNACSVTVPTSCLNVTKHHLRSNKERPWNSPSRLSSRRVENMVRLASFHASLTIFFLIRYFSGGTCCSV